MSTQTVSWTGADAVALFGGCDCTLYHPKREWSEPGPDRSSYVVSTSQSFDRCPMHEAAPAMLAALEEIQSLLVNERGTDLAWKTAARAIAQAKGEA